MNRSRTIGLTAAAMVACASAASATTISQTLSYGPTATNWTHTFSFSGFDTHLGTLTSVTDILTSTVAGTVTVKNTGTGSATFSAFITDKATKSLSGLVVSTSTASSSASGTLASGQTAGPIPLSGTSTTSKTTTTGLSAYEVPTVTGIGTDKGSVSISSSTGNLEASFTSTGEMIDKLVYTYTPAPPSAPEPWSLALLGSGLAFLGLTRRGKRG